ncbi:hypothetical protein N5D61_21380 [Pseudomonas sp. GD03842]|nr:MULTISPECIES: hypothetical protein [unclassified Pseudomonas]MDH0748884.1 hypothetical protein [Pseudomonas sp. GD03842]
MHASDVGLVMMGVIAVLGTLISLLDHRMQDEPPAAKPVDERESRR